MNGSLSKETAKQLLDAIERQDAALKRSLGPLKSGQTAQHYDTARLSLDGGETFYTRADLQRILEAPDAE